VYAVGLTLRSTVMTGEMRCEGRKDLGGYEGVQSRQQNVNPKFVQHQLDHTTISQTMDTYSHVMPDMGDVAADALEAALS
jgi:hypothetical protein